VASAETPFSLHFVFFSGHHFHLDFSWQHSWDEISEQVRCFLPWCSVLCLHLVC
jgi:hypothetical protein